MASYDKPRLGFVLGSYLVREITGCFLTALKSYYEASPAAAYPLPPVLSPQFDSIRSARRQLAVRVREP
jgi:hypothetical protein